MKGVMKLKNKKILDINNLLKNIKSIDKIELDNENFKFDIKFMFGEDMIAYVNKNMEFHREDGPAIQYFNKQGTVYGEKYFLNGEELDEFQVIVLNSKNENTVSKN